MDILFIQITAYQLNQMIPLNILYIGGEILAKARSEDFHCKFYLGYNGSLYTLCNNKVYTVECN